jgi:L-fuconolactonase
MASRDSTAGKINRRELLKSAALVAGALATGDLLAARPARIPVIDTHIHLFDPTRPGGVPWPELSDTVLYKPALPDRYQELAKSFGVVGAIAIEASPLPKDNDWLLATAKKNPLMVGIVGDLVPGSPEFTSELERLHKDPLFLGLRYGNLWNRNLVEDVNHPGFLDGLKVLSQAKLVFESANPNPALVATLADIADRVPELTIVVDHLPHALFPVDKAAKTAYLGSLRRLGDAPRVYIKLSEIPLEQDGKVPKDVASYQDTLDELWNIFGEDKVLFGSDWPNSDHLLPYLETVGILKTYAGGKSGIAQEKLGPCVSMASTPSEPAALAACSPVHWRWPCPVCWLSLQTRSKPSPPSIRSDDSYPPHQRTQDPWCGGGGSVPRSKRLRSFANFSR